MIAPSDYLAEFCDELVAAGETAFAAYGAGVLGQEFVARALERGLRVDRFVDRSNELHGTRINGVPVTSLADAVHEGVSSFVVTSVAFDSEIETAIRAAYASAGRPSPRVMKFPRCSANAVPVEDRPMPGDGPRVLIVCSHFWPFRGGIESMTEEIGRRLVGEGYRVDVATVHTRLRRDDERLGMRIINLDPRPVEGSRYRLWTFQVRALIESGRYDACMFFEDPLGDSFGAVDEARVPPHTRLVFQPVINDEGFAKWRGNAAFRAWLARTLRTGTTISMTRAGADARFFEEEDVPYTFIPNAVPETDIDEAAVASFRRSHAIGVEDFVVLHVANLWPVKNHLGLLASIAPLDPGVKLVMVGRDGPDGAYAGRVRSAIASTEGATMLQGLDREGVAAAMRAANVVVLASHGEGSPVCILEAMSHGRPWVATPTCGAVREHRGGLVVELDRFREAIRQLRQSDAARALGHEGHDQWLREYSFEKVMPLWLSALRCRRDQASEA